MIYHVKWIGLEYYKNRFLEYRKRFKNHYQENDEEIIERFKGVINNKKKTNHSKVKIYPG